MPVILCTTQHIALNGGSLVWACISLSTVGRVSLGPVLVSSAWCAAAYWPPASARARLHVDGRGKGGRSRLCPGSPSSWPHHPPGDDRVDRGEGDHDDQRRVHHSARGLLRQGDGHRQYGKFISCLGDLAALSSCARRASGSPSPSRTPAARDLQPTRPGETRPATCEKILSKLQQLGTGLQQLGCLSVPCPIRVK